MNTAIACSIRVSWSPYSTDLYCWYLFDKYKGHRTVICYCKIRVIVVNNGYLVLCHIGRNRHKDAMLHFYCGSVLHGVVLWYLCHISSMHGSVVGVGRVVTSLDKSEERMTVRRVESKVADQTWWDQLAQIVVAGDRVEGQELWEEVLCSDHLGIIQGM